MTERALKIKVMNTGHNRSLEFYFIYKDSTTIVPKSSIKDSLSRLKYKLIFINKTDNVKSYKCINK